MYCGICYIVKLKYIYMFSVTNTFAFRRLVFYFNIIFKYIFNNRILIRKLFSSVRLIMVFFSVYNFLSRMIDPIVICLVNILVKYLLHKMLSITLVQRFHFPIFSHSVYTFNASQTTRVRIYLCIYNFENCGPKF